jgi:hypothetical protein
MGGKDSKLSRKKPIVSLDLIAIANANQEKNARGDGLEALNSGEVHEAVG